MAEIHFLAKSSIIKSSIIFHGIITKGKNSYYRIKKKEKKERNSFSVSKNYFICVMLHIDFTNDQNTMRRAIRGYIYTLKIKIYVKDNT